MASPDAGQVSSGDHELLLVDQSDHFPLDRATSKSPDLSQASNVLASSLVSSLNQAFDSQEQLMTDYSMDTHQDTVDPVNLFADDVMTGGCDDFGPSKVLFSRCHSLTS